MSVPEGRLQRTAEARRCAARRHGQSRHARPRACCPRPRHEQATRPTACEMPRWCGSRLDHPGLGARAGLAKCRGVGVESSKDPNEVEAGHTARPQRVDEPRNIGRVSGPDTHSTRDHRWGRSRRTPRGSPARGRECLWIPSRRPCRAVCTPHRRSVRRSEDAVRAGTR